MAMETSTVLTMVRRRYSGEKIMRSGALALTACAISQRFGSLTRTSVNSATSTGPRRTEHGAPAIARTDSEVERGGQEEAGIVAVCR